MFAFHFVCIESNRIESFVLSRYASILLFAISSSWHQPDKLNNLILITEESSIRCVAGNDLRSFLFLFNFRRCFDSCFASVNASYPMASMRPFLFLNFQFRICRLLFFHKISLSTVHFTHHGLTVSLIHLSYRKTEEYSQYLYRYQIACWAFALPVRPLKLNHVVVYRHQHVNMFFLFASASPIQRWHKLTICQPLCFDEMFKMNRKNVTKQLSACQWHTTTSKWTRKLKES